MAIVQFVLALLVLIVSAALLWFVSEALEGKEEFELHIGNVLLVSVVGAGLFPFWGWTSTGLVLAGFGGLWITSGLATRLRRGAGSPADAGAAVTDFAFCGTTLLLAIAEFEARLRADQLAEYINAIAARLADWYEWGTGSAGVRDLIISVAPGARHKSWLVSRSGALDRDEAAEVTTLLTHVPAPGVPKPIVFALTYTVGAALAPASLHDVRLPEEWSAIIRQLRGGPIDMEELLEHVWSLKG